MDFLVSGAHVHPVYLIAIGFVVGVLGGFFGVGGSFLAGPALFALRVPMNFVVGTDLAHIVGKSIVAAKRHYKLGHVDVKLGLLMAGGTIAGTEFGAQLIQWLKRLASVDKVIGITFIVVLLSVSGFMGWESWHTIRSRRKEAEDKEAEDKGAGTDGDQPVVVTVAKRQSHDFIHLPPMIKLGKSDIERISLWTILVVAFGGGIFAGLLGGGAGYIRMPSMVYLLGVPTHIAVGTDLFEVVISAGYGTLSHALKGNVDILIALVMHTGAAIGAQIGAALTEQFQGARIRLAFVPLPLIGVALIIYALVTGKNVSGK
jgi:uncharacterized membrane protein YfcA